jgi:hypothetical protein
VFTLNGETGKSVSQYAGQWLKLVGSTKNIIRGQKPLRKSDVLVSSSGSSSIVAASPTLQQICQDVAAESCRSIACCLGGWQVCLLLAWL